MREYACARAKERERGRERAWSQYYWCQFSVLSARLSHVTRAPCDPVAGKGLTRRGRQGEGKNEGVRKQKRERKRGREGEQKRTRQIGTCGAEMDMTKGI